MPFKSEAQRRFLWMHEPAIAKKWSHEYPNQSKLPMHKSAKEKVADALMKRKK